MLSRWLGRADVPASEQWRSKSAVGVGGSSADAASSSRVPPPDSGGMLGPAVLCVASSPST